MAVRDYVQAAESLGYAHVLAYDHVLGANADSRPGWSGAYRHTDQFHEVMVLFAYVAGLTETVELVTGILILPQRQTALVAKQTAEVDLLSGGTAEARHWHRLERRRVRGPERGLYKPRAALRRSRSRCSGCCGRTSSSRTRAAGIPIADGGINPMPVQRPIPVWFGGMDERVLKTARPAR